MSTLIERLRHFARGGSGPVNDACAQAIDEIERLTRALDEAMAGLRKARLVVERRRFDDETERTQLREIALQLRGWLDWQKRERDGEGLPTDDSTHLISVPSWPSRGQLQRWVDVIERAAGPVAPC